MKKATVTISFDEEKLAALSMYLEQKNNKVETELEKALETLYAKNVPAGVREFINMKSGAPSTSPPKQRKQKNSLSTSLSLTVRKKLIFKSPL